jgi:hypothetical protein
MTVETADAAAVIVRALLVGWGELLSRASAEDGRLDPVIPPGSVRVRQEERTVIATAITAAAIQSTTGSRAQGRKV